MAMEEDKYQKELFEFEKPKRLFPRISDLFPKADFERNVALTLTLDKAVFIAIGIVMLIVAVYALGVEAGKRRPVDTVQAQAVPGQALINTQVPAVTTVSRVAASQQLRAIPPTNKIVMQAPAAGIAPGRQTAGGSYTILAATYSNKDNALQEVRRLRLQGLDAMLIQKDTRYLACVGSYQDKGSVQIQNDLKKIRRLHKDAYIRLK